MPWIGARTRHDDKVIQVKVFGPEKKFGVKNDELAEYLRKIANNINGQHPLTDYFGNKMTRMLRDDDNALWVEVEIHSTADYSFSGNTYLIREEVTT